MTPFADVEHLREILAGWIAALDALDRLDAPADVSGDELRSLAKKRQATIEAIQGFDDRVLAIAALGRRGWPGIDERKVNDLDELLLRGASRVDAMVRRTEQLIVTLEKKRSASLRQMDSSGGRRARIAGRLRGLDRRPRVVDERA